jgi:prolyl 4-hydroxylase
MSQKKPLTEEWRTWLRMNLARGCSKEELLDRCCGVNGEGFTREEVEREFQSDNNNNNNNNNTASTTTTTTKFVNNGWKEWIRLQLDQGRSTHEELFQRLAITEGLDLDQVSMALGGYRARNHVAVAAAAAVVVPGEIHHHHRRPPFTKRGFLPRAWKLDTELVELYEIPNFLTLDECREVIQRIEAKSERSVVSHGAANSRTSRTCHLRLLEDETTTTTIDNKNSSSDIVLRVEDKLRALMNHDPTCAEPLQGQWYGPGEYFRPHCDWFSPGEDEYQKHCCAVGGQRTWTVMIYLNFVSGGGTTRFEHLGGREFVPIPGLALAWNNLDADGKTPNHWTLHEAKPVQSGKKYVLTKWFRERSMI